VRPGQLNFDLIFEVFDWFLPVMVDARFMRLYHRSTCDWARRIPSDERIDLPSMTEARDKGFVGCPVCEPWEPT